MRLERHDARLLHQLEQLILEAQQLEIVVLRVPAREEPLELPHQRLDDRHRRGNEQLAHGGAANDQHLGWLEEDFQVAALQHVAAGDAPGHDQHTNY